MRRAVGWGRGTAALAVATGALLLLPAPSSGLDATPPGYDAPPLTAAQRTELGKVKAWRITYRRTWTQGGSWSGDLKLAAESQTSTTSRMSSETVAATFVMSSAGGGPEYTPDPSTPASVSIASSSVVTERYALQACAYVDGNWTPGTRSYTQEQSVNANLAPVGVGAVSDGSAFAFGFFRLPSWVQHRAELNANPPRADVVLRVDTPPSLGTQTNTTGGCLPNSTTSSALPGAASIQVNFRPEATPFDPVGSIGLTGDTQVRVENGRFVIRGSVASEVSTLQCVVSRSGFCTPSTPDLFGTVTTTVSGSWEAVPLVDCAPIPEAKLTDPTVASGLKDDDGDGIPNCWEQNGIQIEKPGGDVITYPLPGADPKRKDLYVEVDYVASGFYPHGGVPSAGTLPAVAQAFANAPVSNPDGSSGITLHASLGDGDAVPPSETDAGGVVGFDTGNRQTGDLWHVKSEGTSTGVCNTGYWGTPGERADPDCLDELLAKRLVYRYALFAYGQEPTSQGGINTSSGVSELGGNDFMVTLGTWDAASIAAAGGQTSAEAGTFMHEFGHALGLFHGGGDRVNCKPNYLSVMNYLFQFPYANQDPNRPLDYSRRALPSLNEASLDEPNGIGGPSGALAVWGRGGLLWTDPANGPIDWSANGATTDLGVSADIKRIDTIDACDATDASGAELPDVVDGRYLRKVFSLLLAVNERPPLSAFEVFVNGAPQTPVALRLFSDKLYLSLASPVTATDTVVYRYHQPASGPRLTYFAGTAIPSFQANATNLSGDRKILTGYEDWSHLAYAFRGSSGFADGQGESAHPNTPDLTAHDVLATVEAAAPPDTTAPTSQAAASPAANAAGWNTTGVTVSLTASDPDGAADVKQITYSATGAQSIATTTVAGATASVPVSAEGATTLTFFATDLAGNVETPQTVTVRVDKTAPSIVAASTTSPNGAGWYKASVVVHFTCADGGSGIPSGSCPADQTLISEGTAVSSAARIVTDAAGNTSSQSNVVSVKIDKTAPTLAAANLSLDATSPLGAMVADYRGVSAGDNLDAHPAVACLPSAPHLFSISPPDADVLCSASDQAGNTATTTFTVHVRGASEQLTNLLAAVTGVGPGSSLADKVKQIQAYVQANDKKDACSTLQAFISEVKAQTGKKLTIAQATAFTAQATSVRATLGC